LASALLAILKPKNFFQITFSGQFLQVTDFQSLN